MCNFREKFWKIRCYQFGGKGSRKQSSPLQEKLKRSCRIKGIVITHLAYQSLWQDGHFESFLCTFFALRKFCKNLAEKIAQNRWKLKRSCCIKGIVIQHLTHQSLWQDGNFDFLFSSSSSSYSWNFVSKSSSNEYWIIKYQVLSGS